MTARTIGLLLIAGPILTFVHWMGMSGSFNPDGKTAAEAVEMLAKNEALVRIASFISAVGLSAMFLGLYYFSRSLKNGDGKGNTCAEVGGLILLLTLPIIVSVQFGIVAAAENASEPAMAEIMRYGGRTLGNGFGFMLPSGMLLVSIAMIMQKKFLIVGFITALVSSAALAMSLVPEVGEGRSMPIMLLMLMSAVIGTLTLIQKEN